MNIFKLYISHYEIYEIFLFFMLNVEISIFW